MAAVVLNAKALVLSLKTITVVIVVVILVVGITTDVGSISLLILGGIIVDGAKTRNNNNIMSTHVVSIYL